MRIISEPVEICAGEVAQMFGVHLGLDRVETLPVDTGLPLSSIWSCAW